MARETRTLHAAFGRAVYYDVDEPFRMHVHSALHALVHLGGAPAPFAFADGERSVADGACATFVDPWVAHRYLGAESGSSRVLALYVEPALVRSPGASLDRPRFAHRSAALPDDALETARALADAVRRGDADESASATFARLVRDLVAGFVVGAGRDAVSGGGRPGAFPGTGAMDRHVRRALAHLNDRKGEPFDGAALVAAAGLGRARLYERFAEVVGLSPKRYADALRAEAAIGMLAADDRSVGEIADALGFAARPHLSRFLRDYTGLGPREHRRASRARGDAGLYVDEFG